MRIMRLCTGLRGVGGFLLCGRDFLLLRFCLIFLALGTRLSALISSIFFRLKVLLFPGV